jgi:GWxTD domain-containing protein
MFQAAYRLIATEAEARELTTTPDDQLESYLHKFWKWRDPTPSTDVNEFKQQFEQRILVAIETYDDVLPPRPWDVRGDVYIKYGPPDDMQSGVVRNDTFADLAWWYFSKDLLISFGHESGQWKLQPIVTIKDT